MPYFSKVICLFLVICLAELPFIFLTIFDMLLSEYPINICVWSGNMDNANISKLSLSDFSNIHFATIFLSSSLSIIVSFISFTLEYFVSNTIWEKILFLIKVSLNFYINQYS